MTADPGEEPATVAWGDASPAVHAWALMQQFVEAHSRHGDYAHALGFSLGAGRGKVLFQLREGPRTLTQLAETNGFDASYATLVVDKLEVHGLVERLPHPGDRRRKLVRLTAAGQAAVAAVDTIRLRPPRAVSGLRAGELRDLTVLLHRLIDLDQPAARPPT